MYPQTDLAIASQIVAARVRHAELERDMRAARSKRPLFRLSLRTAFGRRPVASAAR